MEFEALDMEFWHATIIKIWSLHEDEYSTSRMTKRNAPLLQYQKHTLRSLVFSGLLQCQSTHLSTFHWNHTRLYLRLRASFWALKRSYFPTKTLLQFSQNSSIQRDTQYNGFNGWHTRINISNKLQITKPLQKALKTRFHRMEWRLKKHFKN